MRIPTGTTPARLAGRPDPSGCLILGDSQIAWEHGGEDDAARAVEMATDRSDMSDELAQLGSSWPAYADCARDRGHLLRALDLRPDLRVLEVGAGCGAVSRFLAERCAVLDAVEPNPKRAAIAAQRLSGLSGARVLTGDLAAVPLEPAYDLVVLVGVLEYIGGWKGRDDRVAFLSSIAQRLLPGGQVACAIENRLGVGYLAGGPDDHSGLLFQGIEDHPRPSTARTFSRTELEALFTAAGLHPETLGVFPDYRFPRLVFHRRLLEGPARPLAWRVPRFPTPPHPSYTAARVLDERRAWRSLVEAGVGLEFANSFLVLAGRDAPQAMWPAQQLAAFYTTGRRRRYLTETRVIDRAGGIELVRTRLTPASDDDRYLQRGYTAPYHDGPTLLELLAEADDASLRVWLQRYVELLERELHDTEGGVPFDLWPDNLIAVGSQLVVADHELVHRAMPAEEVLPRGLLLTALELADRTPPDRWSVGTVRELVDELADAAGVERPGSLAPVIDRQAECLADIFGGEPGSVAWQTKFDEARTQLEQALAAPLDANVQSARDAGAGMWLRTRRAEADAQAARAALRDVEAALAKAAQEREAAAAEAGRLADALARVQNSRSWLITAPMRRAGRGWRSVRTRAPRT